jgi:hypothetical protein
VYWKWKDLVPTAQGTECVVVRTTGYQTELYIQCTQRFGLIKARGHYIYRQFNIQQFYVLPTQCIYVFCVDLRTNSDYLPVQH